VHERGLSRVDDADIREVIDEYPRPGILKCGAASFSLTLFQKAV
jgi:hypothetical protein